MPARRESPPIIIIPKPEKPKEEAKSAKEKAEQPSGQLTKKSPVGKVAIGAVALIIVVILVIGNLGTVYNIIEEIHEAEEEKPLELRRVHYDDYSDPEKNKNYLLSQGYGYRKNGKFIIEAKETTHVVRQTFTSDNIGIKFTVRKIAGYGQSAFGCSVEDGASAYTKYPLNIYDGILQILLKPRDGRIYHGGMETGKLYQVEVKRIVETRGFFLFKSSKVYLSFKVNNEYKEISYPLPSRKDKEISLYFVSENSAKFEIDDLAIYAGEAFIP